MVNKFLQTMSRLIWCYLGVVLATFVALIVLSSTAPDQASSAAWGHAIIVAAFAVLLPLRIRSARRGSTAALGAVAIIATVLGVVNLVEAFVPAFPGWLRISMLVVAVIMAALAAVAVRARCELPR